jgi:hypothetical protein
MVKNKLRIRRLTLAPGALRRSSLDEDGDGFDEEVDCIHDREQLHRAVEIIIESSLAH